MISEEEKVEMCKEQVIKKIALTSGLLIVFAGLCILFFKYINFDSDESAMHMGLFIGVCLLFVIGFIGTIIPRKFHNAFYKIGVNLLSKSLTMDYMGLDVVSQKRTWKSFIWCIVLSVIISYILLAIIILINAF